MKESERTHESRIIACSAYAPYWWIKSIFRVSYVSASITHDLRGWGVNTIQHVDRRKSKCSFESVIPKWFWKSYFLIRFFEFIQTIGNTGEKFDEYLTNWKLCFPACKTGSHQMSCTIDYPKETEKKRGRKIVTEWRTCRDRREKCLTRVKWCAISELFADCMKMERFILISDAISFALQLCSLYSAHQHRHFPIYMLIIFHV